MVEKKLKNKQIRQQVFLSAIESFWNELAQDVLKQSDKPVEDVAETQNIYWTIETPEGEIVNFIAKTERDAWWWLSHDHGYIVNEDTLDALISDWKAEGYKAVKLVSANHE